MINLIELELLTVYLLIYNKATSLPSPYTSLKKTGAISVTVEVQESNGYLCSAEVLGLRVVQPRPHGQLPQARRAVDGRRLHRGCSILDHRHLHTYINTPFTLIFLILICYIMYNCKPRMFKR